MGRELSARERHDETYDWAGLLVREYVTSRYPVDAEILDVGAGRGKYRELLPEYPNIDAVEVHAPTVDAEDLRGRYRHVFVADVVTLVRGPFRQYDMVVMGDVLEHMTVKDARNVLQLLMNDGSDIVVIVPYLYPQDEEDGNVHQRHIQDDLTPELMIDRYPQLELIALETRDWRPFKGFYRSKTWQA